MKKISITALVIALAGVLCACNRGTMNPGDTTGMTMPSVITTVPTTENNNDGFRPDQDGLIGQTETTNPTQASRGRDRLRLR